MDNIEHKGTTESTELIRQSQENPKPEVQTVHKVSHGVPLHIHSVHPPSCGPDSI